MAMRYLIRRDKAENLNDLESEVSGLKEKLGAPAADLRCDIPVVLSEKRYFQLQFLTRKTGTGWVWVCPSIELVAEDEKGLVDLMAKFKLHKPEHLAHL